MNVKINELKGKLAKSTRRTLMMSVICGDDGFLVKVLEDEPLKIFSLIDKNKKEVSNFKEEQLGDIANNAIVALQSANKGKNSVERARNYLDAFTSLTFESKDELALDDYCNAVCRLRLLQKDILPEDKIMSGEQYRKQYNNKIKNFIATAEGVQVSVENFLTKEMQTANNWLEVSSVSTPKTAEDKKNSQCLCAQVITEFIDDNVTTAEERRKFGNREFIEDFADWVTLEMYKQSPKVTKLIGSVSDNMELVSELFSNYILWIRENEPELFVVYLEKSTKTEDDAEIIEDDESKCNDTKEAKHVTEEQSNVRGPVFVYTEGVSLIPNFQSIISTMEIFKYFGNKTKSTETV